MNFTRPRWIHTMFEMLRSDVANEEENTHFRDGNGALRKPRAGKSMENAAAAVAGGRLGHSWRERASGRVAAARPRWRRHDSAAVDHLRIASSDLLDAHGAVVARGADLIDLRTQPTTHPVTDFAEFNTTPFSGTLTPRSTVRLRAAGRLHTDGVAASVTYPRDLHFRRRSDGRGGVGRITVANGVGVDAPRRTHQGSGAVIFADKTMLPGIRSPHRVSATMIGSTDGSPATGSQPSIRERTRRSAAPTARQR